MLIIFFYDLLPFYAILRSIPNKLLGVIAMFSAIVILLAMPFTDLSRSRGIQFRPLSKIVFYIFIGNFLILMQLGAKHVESPFIEFGQISTVIYFSHFLIIVPLISLLENSLIELSSSSKANTFVSLPLQSFFCSPVLLATLPELQAVQVKLIAAAKRQLTVLKDLTNNKTCGGEFGAMNENQIKYITDQRIQLYKKILAHNARIAQVQNGFVDTQPADATIPQAGDMTDAEQDYLDSII